MIARDVMKTSVLRVAQDLPLSRLAEIFRSRGISGAPVEDGNGELVGVVSQSDLVRKRGLQAPEFKYVRDVMTPAALAAMESTPVRELAKMMLRRRIHRIFILRKGRLVGVVSSLDLLEALLEEPAVRSSSRRKSKKAR